MKQRAVKKTIICLDRKSEFNIDKARVDRVAVTVKRLLAIRCKLGAVTIGKVTEPHWKLSGVRIQTHSFKGKVHIALLEQECLVKCFFQFSHGSCGPSILGSVSNGQWDLTLSMCGADSAGTQNKRVIKSWGLYHLWWPFLVVNLATSGIN